MKDIRLINNAYNDDKVIDACSIFGAMNTSGARFSGEGVIKAIANMHDRGNGLGGGFAVYGLYPNFPDQYAFHIMYLNQQARKDTEEFLQKNFNMVHKEEVPTQSVAIIKNPPLVCRYFLDIGVGKPEDKSGDDYVVEKVMEINTRLSDTFVFSSGKDMAVFKGGGRRGLMSSAWTLAALTCRPTMKLSRPCPARPASRIATATLATTACQNCARPSPITTPAASEWIWTPRARCSP